MNLVKNTLSEQIYQILRNDILNRTIPLGEKLTLKTMQERFGVSSTPIRDAFTRLTEDGLVDYCSNVGVNVIRPDRNDLIELYQFMGDLDSLAILYSSRHPDQAQVCTSLESILQQAGQARQTDIQLWINDSDQFHLVFYDYCSNSRLKRTAEKQRSQLTIFSNLYETVPDMQEQISSWHSRIYDAYREGDADQAARLMREHLEQSLQFALKMLEEF